jgi:hypothetical protein
MTEQSQTYLDETEDELHQMHESIHRRINSMRLNGNPTMWLVAVALRAVQATIEVALTEIKNARPIHD